MNSLMKEAIVVERVASAEIVRLNKQLTPLKRVLALADELCVAVDNAADDIGGSRPINEILGELGPAVDAAQDAVQ